jgi:threonine synthase
MDVGDPSNLARILQLYGGNLDRLREDLAARSYSDDETRACIARVYETAEYILDPHSAVGMLALEAELEQQPDAVGILLATAHPAKFAEVVEPLIGREVPLPATMLAALKSERRAIALRRPDPAGLREIIERALA